MAGCAQRFDEYCRDQGSYRVDVHRPRHSRSERHRNKVLSIGWDRVGSGSRSIRGRAPGVRGSGCGGETVAAAHVGDVVVGARGGGDPSAGLLIVGVRPGSALTGDAEVGAVFCGCCARGCYPIASADYPRGEICRRAQCAEFRSARCDRLRATLSGVSLGVGDSPAAGDGSRRIGRIPLARVVWDARGPLPVGACREGPCSATRCLGSVPPSGRITRQGGW